MTRPQRALETQTVRASWGSQRKIRRLIEQGWRVESTVWGKTILSREIDR